MSANGKKVKEAPQFRCGAQRRMTPSKYLAYDGMVARAKSKAAREGKDPDRDPLIFYAKLTTLANELLISK